MQCNELQAVLADDELNALSPEAREHLSACSACRDLLADFSTIANVARSIPAEVNPPERIWVSLRAQLEAEGIIHEPQSVAEVRASWWEGFAQLFRPRALAMAAAAVLVVSGSIYLINRPAQNSNPSTAKVTTPAVKPTAKPSRTEPAPAQTAAVAPKHRPAAAPAQPQGSTGELLPSPSETAYLGDSALVLSQAESAVPSRKLARNAMVDAALRQNLRTLNDFIAECEARLKEDPQDHLAREYLNMAYQQKAELLTAMLDSGRSEH